jgi:repressor LexA
MATYTEKQRNVLEIVRTTVEERGIAPTLEEIAFEMGGISRVAVLEHLRALERKGAVKRKARESRAIEILDPEYQPGKGGIPLAGRIAAGEPILEVAEREEVMLADYLRVDDGCFLLEVQGDSMIEDHIVDGDLVLIESRKSARDGETVVAVVEGETTLKRLYREGRKIRLQPANEALEPRVYPAAQVQIRGVLKGVIRRS